MINKKQWIDYEEMVDGRKHEISLPDSPQPQQLQPAQKIIGSDTQFCSLDDGR